MNKLTYIGSTEDRSGSTYVYVTPTNSQHVVSLSEADQLILHVLNTDGSPLTNFPVQYDDDGVFWAINDLGQQNAGTYAFYLELKYVDGKNTYSEYYPDDSVKYMTVVANSNSGNDNGLDLVNIYNADYNNLKPIRPPKSPDTDGGNLYDDDLIHNIKIAQTVTLPAGQPARVEIKKNTVTFYIPAGQSGESAYQAWLNNGHKGTESDFLNSLVVKASLATPENRRTIQNWIQNINQSNDLGSYINVKEYGANGDGIVDDTSNLQDAINAAHRNGGGLILLPTGIYNISSPLTLYSNVSITGTNIFATTIKMTKAKPFINAVDVDDVTLNNITFTSDSSVHNQGLTFSVKNNTDLRNLTLSNLIVEQSSDNGLTLHNPMQVLIQSCLAQNNQGNGFAIIGPSADAKGNASVQMSSDFASGNGKAGFDLENLGFSNFTSLVARNNYNGIRIINNRSNSFNSCGELNTQFNSADTTTGIGYYITGGNSLNFNGMYSDKSGVASNSSNNIGMYVDAPEITVSSFHQDGPSKYGIQCTSNVKNSSFYGISVPSGVSNDIPDVAQINPIVNTAIENTTWEALVNFYNTTMKSDMQADVDAKTTTAIANIQAAETQAVTTLTANINNSTNSMKSTVNSAISNMQGQTSEAISKVNQQTSSTISSLNSQANSTFTANNNKTTSAISTMQANANKTLSDVVSKADANNTANDTKLDNAIKNHAWTAVLANNTDLNTVTSGNMYRADNVSLKNAPSGETGQYSNLLVIGGPTNGTQIYTSTNTHESWSRTWYNGNNFSDWRQFALASHSIWSDKGNYPFPRSSDNIADLNGADAYDMPHVGDLVVMQGGDYARVTVVRPGSNGALGTYGTSDKLGSLVPQVTVNSSNSHIQFNGNDSGIPLGKQIVSITSGSYANLSASDKNNPNVIYAVTDGVPQKSNSDYNFFQIGTVTTGNPGTNASASVVKGTDGVYRLNLVIPRGNVGATGATGPAGAPGKNGATGATGPAGAPGKNGTNGTNGYTPVRGKDYWTDADQQAIKNWVDNAISSGTW